MAGALAMSALALLLGQTVEDVQVGARVEARATTVDQAGLPRVTRAAYAATPGAQLLARADWLLLTLAYAPTFWSSDLAGDPSPIVNQRAKVSLEASDRRRWRALGTVAGSRVWSDPLGDLRSASVLTGQVATVQKVNMEDLRADLLGAYGLDERTTVAVNFGWMVSQTVDPAQRDVLPTQRNLMAGSTLWRVLSERDRLQLDVNGQRIETTTAGTTTLSAFAAGTADWYRTLTLGFQGRLGAGATLVWPGTPGGPYQVLPTGTVQLIWDGDASASGDIGVRLTAFVDRWTGQVGLMMQGTANLRMSLGETLALTAVASAGARPNGETKLAGLDVRLNWSILNWLALDSGLRAWRQVEQRPTLPTFNEAAVFVAVVFGSNARALGGSRTGTGASGAGGTGGDGFGGGGTGGDGFGGSPGGGLGGGGGGGGAGGEAPPGSGPPSS